MTVAQRRQMTLDHLQRISQALEAYAAREGSYPPRAIYSTAGQPLLSWRVHLLPQLGYESLYAQFHLDEPWDSPHNQMLAEQIPSVYQSPERCDKRTNYLLPCASTTAFHGPQVKPSRRWEDGATSTVILVEADDALAVLWTEPRDLDFQSATPRAGLSKLRGDGFFAVFGGGRLSRIPPEVDDRTLRALFTIDGGETVSPGALGEPALAEAAASTGDATTTTQTPPAVASAGTPSLAPAAIIPNENGPSETAAVGGSGQLMEQARAAAAAGLETEAIRCCYGAYLLGESGSTEWFRWVPGLRRPALAVRIGVGLDFVGANRKPIERLATPHRGSDDWPRQRAELETIVGDLGPALLSALESVPRFLPPPLTVTSTTSTTGRKSAAGPGGVTFLGVADESTLCQVARRDFVDCLILFVVEERTPRRGQAHKSVEVRMMDAVGGRTLYSSPNVNYLRRELSLKDPLYEDPIPRVVTEFEAILVQQLQPQDMPQQLRRTRVTTRHRPQPLRRRPAAGCSERNAVLPAPATHLAAGAIDRLSSRGGAGSWTLAAGRSACGPTTGDLGLGSAAKTCGNQRPASRRRGSGRSE